MAEKEQKINALKKYSDSKLPLVRIIIVFSIIITVLNTAIVVKRGSSSYNGAIEQGKEDAMRLSHTLSDHVNLTFLAVDLALRHAVEKQYFNALFGNNLIEDMQNNFLIRVNETPQISAMLMADDRGVINAIYRKQGYKTWMDGKEYVDDKPYFLAHKNADDSDMLYVGWQSSWIKNDKGFVVMSRRVNKLNGKFGGIVMIAVDINYIMNFFNLIEVDKKTKFSLLRDDGGILISMEDDVREVSRLEKAVNDNRFFFKTGEKEQIRTVMSGQNGNGEDLRLYSLVPVPHLHMLLAIVNYGEDIFKSWHKQRVNDMVFLGIFMLFVLVVSLFAVAVAKQMQRVQRSEASAVLASQAKSDFLANMSHELRTPLNAIIGFSEMIEAGYFGKVNPKQKERIHDINFCGNHLLELINDILEFSKGDAGKIELRIEKISMPKIIADSIRIVSEKAKRNKVAVISNITEEMPLIAADGRKIKQVLINLLSNAIKFTKEGGTIEVMAGFDEERNVVLSVTDTGIGMAEEDIPKALSAFGQVHQDPTYGGTGLGLPLCKMFAELHGGEMRIQSIKNVGTKVSIILPADRVINPKKNNIHTIHVNEDVKKFLKDNSKD